MKNSANFFEKNAHWEFQRFLKWRDVEEYRSKGPIRFTDLPEGVISAAARLSKITVKNIGKHRSFHKLTSNYSNITSGISIANKRLEKLCRKLGIDPPFKLEQLQRGEAYYFVPAGPVSEDLSQQLQNALSKIQDWKAPTPKKVPEHLARLKPFLIENFLRKDEHNPNPDPTQPGGFQWVHFESGCFVESDVSKEALSNLEKYKHLRIEGDEASGKTTLARYLGYILKNDKGKMVICTEPWQEIGFPGIRDLSKLGEYYLIVDDVHIPEAMRFVEKELEGGRGQLILVSRGIDLGSVTHRFARLRQFLEEAPVLNVKAEEIAHDIISNVATHLKMCSTEVEKKLDNLGLNWRDDLVNLSFGCRTLKDKGSLTELDVMTFVRKRMGEDLETEYGLKKKEAEKVFIALAMFYQFEIPLLKAFVTEYFDITEDLINQLVKLRQIVSYYSEFGEMLRLYHSSWARLCMDCFRYFDDFPTRFKVRFGTPSRKCITEIYMQYLKRFPQVGVSNLPDLLYFCDGSGPRSHYDSLSKIPLRAWESQDLVLTTLKVLNADDIGIELRKLYPDWRFNLINGMHRLCSWPILFSPKDLRVVTRSLKEITKAILAKDWPYAAMKGVNVNYMFSFPPGKIHIDDLIISADTREHVSIIFRYDRDCVAKFLDEEYEARKDIFNRYITEDLTIVHSSRGVIAHANKTVAKQLLAEFEIYTDMGPRALGELLKHATIIDPRLAKHFLKQAIKLGLVDLHSFQDEYSVCQLLKGLSLVDESLALDLCDTLDVQGLNLGNLKDLIFSLAPYSHDVPRKILSICVEKGPLSVENLRQFFSPEAEQTPFATLSCLLALLTHFLPKKSAELLLHLPLQWLKDRLEPIRLAQLVKCIAQHSPLVKRTLAKVGMKEFLDYEEVIWLDVKKLLQYVTTWYCVNKTGWQDIVHRSGCDYIQEIPSRALIKYSDRRKVFEDGKVWCEQCDSDIFDVPFYYYWYLFQFSSLKAHMLLDDGTLPTA